MALSALLSRESQERKQCSCHGLGSGESKVMTWGLLVLPSSHPAMGLNSHRATSLFHKRDVYPGKCRAHGGLWEIDQLLKMFSPLFCTSNLSHPEQCFMARFNGEGAWLLFSSGRTLLELRPDLSKSTVGKDTYRHWGSGNAETPRVAPGRLCLPPGILKPGLKTCSAERTGVRERRLALVPTGPPSQLHNPGLTVTWVEPPATPQTHIANWWGFLSEESRCSLRTLSILDSETYFPAKRTGT